MALTGWLAASLAGWLTASLAGWLAASLAVAVAMLAWRSFSVRMDAVARACHELRGPITAARLGLQLGTRVGELSPVRLQAIDVELGRAALALDDLAGTGAIACRPRVADLVDARALVSDSVEAWSAAAASRGVALSMRWNGAGATVLGDRFRLAQATGNLIANAIEHGGPSVEVSGHAAGDVVRIEVIDGGPGLPAPVTQLARPGSRRRRRRTGRGHGLAVALAVAEAHGGRLAAAPARRGARLVLELPVAADQQPLVPGGTTRSPAPTTDLVHRVWPYPKLDGPGAIGGA
jgi:signal transduction histidine kinase